MDNRHDFDFDLSTLFYFFGIIAFILFSLVALGADVSIF